MNKELQSLSDGALRVARRKALYSLQNMKEIYGRLNLEESGDFKTENSCAYCQGTAAWGADHLASNIKTELDRRGADYKSREEVMN